MPRLIVISGCSGGGKSTLLSELAKRGHSVIEEPGRRIIAEEVAAGRTSALPWVDLSAFAARAVAMARANRDAALRKEGWVFFDRGLIDAAAALEHASGGAHLERLCRPFPYDRLIFMVPPWPEIFATDDVRRHDMSEAAAEYDRLLTAYAGLGYNIEILPKASVAERADRVVARLRLSPPAPPSSSSSSRRGSYRPSRV